MRLSGRRIRRASRQAQSATQPQEPKPGAREAGQFSAADREFLQKAASSGHAEVELAKLAQQKAQGQACKDLARALEQDHSKVNSELQQIASRKNVTLDIKPSPEDEQLKEKLESLDGPAFDRAYAEAMVKNHQRSIQSFQRATASKDPDVSAFAEKNASHAEEAPRAGESGRAGRFEQLNPAAFTGCCPLHDVVTADRRHRFFALDCDALVCESCAGSCPVAAAPARRSTPARKPVVGHTNRRSPPRQLDAIAGTDLSPLFQLDATGRWRARHVRVLGRTKRAAAHVRHPRPSRARDCLTRPTAVIRDERDDRTRWWRIARHRFSSVAPIQRRPARFIDWPAAIRFGGAARTTSSSSSSSSGCAASAASWLMPPSASADSFWSAAFSSSSVC